MPVVPIFVPTHLSHGEKPEKFNGNDFKIWQEKMLFYLTTLNLARFLHEEALVCNENEIDHQVIAMVDAWMRSNFLCKNYILNGLDSTLYNVQSPIKTARELWESLDRKYKTKDVGMKKFVVGRFLDYKMVDSKTIISQVQDLQVILHEIHAEGMMLSESFQVDAIIEKLLPNWKDFKNYLKDKCKEMKLEDLIVRLRIEEDNRVSKKKVGNHYMESKAHMIEEGHKTNKKMKYVGQQGAKGGDSKRFKGNCFMCNKLGHHSNDCRNSKAQVNHKRKVA